MADRVNGSLSLDSHHDDIVVGLCPLGGPTSESGPPGSRCDKTYIGETGRMFKTRFGEHRKETENVGMKIRTRSVAQETEAQCLKSVVSEHCGKKNHIMNCEECKSLESESNKKRR